MKIVLLEWLVAETFFLPLQVSQLCIKLHLNNCARQAGEQFCTEYSVNFPHINQVIHSTHQRKDFPTYCALHNAHMAAYQLSGGFCG